MPLRLGVDPRFQDRERQPGLDLLRALAIIVVIIYHAALWGFRSPVAWITAAGSESIFRPQRLPHRWATARAAGAQEIVKLGRFFARRVLRIMPAYFVILAIYLLFRPGASTRTWPSRSGNSFSLSKTSRFTAGPPSHTPGRSRSKTNSISVLPFLLLFISR